MIITHGGVLVVAQLQSPAVVTPTLPVPLLALKFWPVGLIVKVQVTTVTATHAENSEVLPVGSVAVAVMTCPAGITRGSVRLMLALQPTSVLTLVKPR